MSTASSDPDSTGGGPRGRRRTPRGGIGTTGARFGSPALRRSLEEQPAEPPPKPPRRRRSLRGEVGATGARFGSAALRRSLDEQEEQRQAELEETAPFAEPVEPEPEPEWPAIPAGRAPEPEPEPAVEEFSGPLVRPYAWTGGRTASHYDLRLETLVSLEASGIAIAMRVTNAEQRAIVELCANGPRSLAELSALLSVPLGVARVLVGDLIALGVVAVHENATTPGGPDLALLERVLAGLRDL